MENKINLIVIRLDLFLFLFSDFTVNWGKECSLGLADEFGWEPG